MIADAIVTAIAGICKFNPERSTNPFAYFTQIAYHCFLIRIATEKKQQYVKYKNFQNMVDNGSMDDTFSDGDNMIQSKNDDVANELISTFENKLLTKKKKPVRRSVEELITTEV
jgi:hypothetical protein